MSDGIDLRFRRSNQTFGTSLSFENDILSLLNNRGDVLSSVNIDLIKKEELPTANEDNLGVIYLYTGPDGEYKHGYFYECVENSGIYSWENIIVQDSYLKSETYNKTETDTELDKKLNIDGSNTFTGVLKMKSTISFKGAIAPSWDGIGFFKLNDNNSVSLMASMEDIDGFSPASNNTYNIGTNARRWKDLYLAGKVHVPTINNGGDITVPTSAGTMALTSDLTNFADKDLSNLTSTGKNIANWSSNVSNCITEIPQDIKLELNNGTLTLKAGSKVYVPNGSGVFDTVTIVSDMVLAKNASGKYFIFMKSASASDTMPVDYCYSGSSAPTVTTTYAIWFDTTNNKIKWTNNNGSTWTDGYSFPLCIVINDTPGTQNVSSIDQVFNGFGYIGSTVFALPGVKGLIPNGRNEDGTLKSIEVTISDVKTFSYNATGNYFIILDGQGNIAYRGESAYYDEKENLLNNYGSMRTECIIGKCYLTAGVISNFEIKTPFHAVDYSDTEFIGHQAMPSDRYINLTLLATGNSYTAPADGYFQFFSNAVTNSILINSSTNYGNTVVGYSGFSNYNNVKASKGDSIILIYDILGGQSFLHFIYTNGSK